jgi:predicted secreted protein
MQFDESANGSEVEVSAGEEFDISLPGTPTAGYRWFLKSAGGAECAPLESSQAGTEKIGGTGTDLWHFRAPASGTCSIVLEYRRSWETSSEPARTFTLKVRVRSSASLLPRTA